MNGLILLIILLIVHFQYRLWLGDASLTKLLETRRHYEDLVQDVQEKKDRNKALLAELKDLHEGRDVIEERARYELGMIKENETFFQVLE